MNHMHGIRKMSRGSGGEILVMFHAFAIRDQNFGRKERCMMKEYTSRLRSLQGSFFLV